MHIANPIYETLADREQAFAAAQEEIEEMKRNRLSNFAKNI
jgi:hypothetical protein